MRAQSQHEAEVVTKLRILMMRHLNLTDLCELAQEMGIDYENWREGGKQHFVLGFLTFVTQKEQLPALVRRCRKKWPNFDWPNLARRRLLGWPPTLQPPSSTNLLSWFFVVGAVIMIIVLIVILVVLRLIDASTNLTPTQTPSQIHALPMYDLTMTGLYTAPSSAFTMTIPQGWEPYTLEPDANEGTLARVTFRPQRFPNLYWLMQVEVNDITRLRGISLEDLAPFVKDYIGNSFSQFPNITTEDPLFTLDRKAIQVYWTFSMPGPDNAPVPMRALTRVRVQDKIMTVFTLYMPRDQFDPQAGAIQTLRDSIIITSEFKER